MNPEPFFQAHGSRPVYTVLLKRSDFISAIVKQNILLFLVEN